MMQAFKSANYTSTKNGKYVIQFNNWSKTGELSVFQRASTDTGSCNCW